MVEDTAGKVIALEVKVNGLESDLKRVREDIVDIKGINKDMVKDVSDIKANQDKTMFVTEQVQKTQEAMAIANEKNQALVASNNKENQATMMAGFKAIEDRRIADEKAVALKKESDDKEKQRLKELDDDREEDLRKEKRAQTRAIWLVFYALLANTLYGLLKIYVPKLVGL